MAAKSTKQALSAVEEAMIKRQSEIQAIISAKKTQMKIDYINSTENLQRSMLNEDISTINAILSVIKENYSLDGRKLQPTFGYGTIPNALITLSIAILYAKEYEKEELLHMANTTIDTVEQLVDAMGRESYFSPKHGMLIDEVPMDVSKVKSTLQQLITDLTLVSDISLDKFNQDRIDQRFTKARIKAELANENFINYIQGVDDTIYVD